MELTVRGTYMDLIDFLADLEKLPWRLIWGRSEFLVDAYPAITLRVTLYTLSTDRAAGTL